TVVINKDFMEWRVLDRAFPDAKVVLCQFHALTYWRKVCARAKFNLSMNQRDAMEICIRKSNLLISWMLLWDFLNYVADCVSLYVVLCVACPVLLRVLLGFAI
ncbi:hypothetical protein PHYSODRAFT_535661, partial [Phytophthora sojae]